MRIVIKGALSEDITDRQDLLDALRARLNEVFTESTDAPVAVYVDDIELA